MAVLRPCGQPGVADRSVARRSLVLPQKITASYARSLVRSCRWRVVLLQAVAKKQTKVTARIAETGRRVHAANDEDWAYVHRPGDPNRPILYCPDSSAGCANQLSAVENRIRADGGRLRSFRFTKNTAEQDRCQHAAADAVLVEGKESEEHLWLKQYVCQTAQDLGYTTETERPLNSGLVADVWVDDAVACQRVEVQRVRTDIPDRTDPHPDVVWLIREYSRSNKAMNRYLFTNPCVRVNIFDSERNPVQPWADPCATYNICAYATVLRRSKAPTTVADFFETGELPLRTFLREVWSGERKWMYDLTVYKFACWVRVTDLDERKTWLKVQREQAAARAAEIAAHREREQESRFPARPNSHPSPAPAPRRPRPPTPSPPTPRSSLPHGQRQPPEPASPPTMWQRLVDWLVGR